MGRERFFRYGELPLVLLALLDATPRSGYELMAELDRLFGPAYRPSPGSVYPALKAMTAERLVGADASAGAATYRLTDLGQQALVDRRDDLASIEHRTGRRLVGDDEVEAALARLRARIAAVAGRLDHTVIARELDHAATRIERATLTASEGRP